MSAGGEADLRALAERLGLDVEFLRECVRDGVLVSEEDALAAARLRRLQRLCRGLELDAFAGSIIVELLEQLDDLRRGA